MQKRIRDSKSRVAIRTIRLGRQVWVLKLRRFRTNPQFRSKKSQQIVFPVKLLAYREIALIFGHRTVGQKTIRGTYASQTITVLALVVGLAGMAYFGNLSVAQSKVPVGQQLQAPANEDLQKTVKTNQIKASKPLNITIPTINLDVPVTTVGLTNQNKLETPPLFEAVTGWYKNSPTPGEIGPAIIVGHVDTYTGPSVFYKLHKLKAGDKISILRQDETIIDFTVDRVAQYEQADFPTEEVFGNTEDSQLRLITCGGDFDYQTNRYSHNTVVYASMVDMNLNQQVSYSGL